MLDLRTNEPLTFGSLFSGIGGIDLALEQVGFVCKWQVEKDKFARRALEIHFPDIKRYEDATSLCYAELERVYLLAGGDPCPSRSRARRGKPSVHPDLSPYFLEAVRQLRPVWVFRENVPAPDVHQFALCLEWMGYSTVVLAVDSAEVTSQSRPREVIVGVHSSTGICPTEIFSQRTRAARNREARKQMGTVTQCLTTGHSNNNSEDTYILEPGRGTRRLTAIEYARLQDFHDGYLDGFSTTQQKRLYGNAVTVGVFRQIGEMIYRYGAPHRIGADVKH